MSKKHAAKVDKNIALLEQAGATGTSIRQTCVALGISTKTFYTHRNSPKWQAAYDRGMSQAVITIGGELYKKAKGGDLNAIMTFLRRYSEAWQIPEGSQTAPIVQTTMAQVQLPDGTMAQMVESRLDEATLSRIFDTYAVVKRPDETV